MVDIIIIVIINIPQNQEHASDRGNDNDNENDNDTDNKKTTQREEAQTESKRTKIISSIIRLVFIITKFAIEIVVMSLIRITDVTMTKYVNGTYFGA